MDEILSIDTSLIGDDRRPVNALFTTRMPEMLKIIGLPAIFTYEKERLGYPNSENKGGDHRMNKLLRSLITLTIVLAVGSSLSACGFNTINKTQMKTKAVPNAQTRMLSDTTWQRIDVRTADQMAKSIER